MGRVIKVQTQEQLNRFKDLSKFTIGDIKEMISKGDKLKTLEEYEYLLNCIIIDGTDETLEHIEKLIPNSYHPDKKCSVCGYTTLGNSYDEPHGRTLCPVCEQVEDIYLSWEDHRELMDGSILWFNYFGETWDLKEGARRLYRDLKDENRKVFNVVPFIRRDNSEYSLPYFKETIKSNMNEYYKLFLSVKKLSEEDESAETQLLVNNIMKLLNERSDYSLNGLPYRVKRIVLDSSELHNKQGE